MNILGIELHLPRFSAAKRQPRRTGGTMTYSESVAPLTGRRKLGFVMFSTLDEDKARAPLSHGAIPSKGALMEALKSDDLWFREISRETTLYFSNREAHAKHKQSAEKELADLDYLLFFSVTHEAMDNTHILQDILRPRLYNSQCQLVKRMEECYWTDQAIPSELPTFIESLARAIKMEIRAIIRRQETGKRTERQMIM